MLDNPAAPVYDAGRWLYRESSGTRELLQGRVWNGAAARADSGPERFDWAFRKYIKDWAFKHPSPSDFFRAMESEGGEELGWFWQGWYMNNWSFDLAVSKIEGDEVTFVNKGQLVLPATVEVRYRDGSTTRFRLPVETWESKGEVVWTGDKPVLSATVDPDHVLPDNDRANNAMTAK